MIILVSDDPVQSEALCTQLRQKGYLYSVVPDDRKALESVRNDRASLVIIDTGCTSFDGFNLCTMIKTDETLQHLPVLLVTGISDLSVLLKVLNAHADAFITTPCDPPSFLSVLDDLLNAQEREKGQLAVRTRFRITHEGCDYYVVADRRQLLELLLFTFELAVRTRNEQEQVLRELHGAIKELNDRLLAVTNERDITVKNLHGNVEEQTRIISRLNAAAQAKEQQESILRTQYDKISQDLREKDPAFENNKRILEGQSTPIAALEGQIAALIKEKGNAEQESQERMSQVSRSLSDMEGALIQAQEQFSNEREQARALKEEIAALTGERDQFAQSHETAITSHTQVQKEFEAQCRTLEEEQRARASSEAELVALREKYEGIQKFLDSASRDIGVLNAALAEEKEKRKTVEERLNAVIREIGIKDRTIEALNKERTALKNELDEKKNLPLATGEPAGAPSPKGAETDPKTRKPADAPFAGNERERGINEHEPLLPLPPTVQMKLPEPAPAIPLPEAPAQEQKEPATESHQKDEVPEGPEGPEVPGDLPATKPALTPPAYVPADSTMSRDRWFDMIKWVHHTESIPADQRKELLGNLMKMSRLVQKGRHLTSRQDESMKALITQVQALGYRFH
jgi:DNA-binding response OmpR family regulator